MKYYCFVCGCEMFTVVLSRHGLGSWEEQQCEKGCVQPSVWEQQLIDRQFDDEAHKKDVASGLYDPNDEYDPHEEADTGEDLQDYDRPREGRYHDDPDEVIEWMPEEAVTPPTQAEVQASNEDDDIPF